MRFFFLLLSVASFSLVGVAEEKSKVSTDGPARGASAPANAPLKLPYLGPGSDKLSPEEYMRTYSQYLKESILMGFPPRTCVENSCELGLAHLFSSSGLVTDPIPSGADIEVWKHSEGLRECYESGGTIAQVVREKGSAPLRAIVVFSKSPKAVKTLALACRDRDLTMERQEATGLERIAGVPVGYPHPLLCPESQGLIVKRLDLSGDRKECRPMGFEDNSWASQLRLSESSCAAGLNDLQLALQRKISPAEMAKRERERQKNRILTIVRAKGASQAEAEAIWKRNYTGPITHDVTVVGQAMRNIEYCNAFQIGQNPSLKGKPGEGGEVPSSSGGTGSEKAR